MSDDDYDDEMESQYDDDIDSKVTISKIEIISKNDTYKNYYTETKKTKPILTKFEKAKILGVRAEMIANGSPLSIKPPANIYNSNTPSYDLAVEEFKERKIPLLIRRYLPDGNFEDWRLEDLIINC